MGRATHGGVGDSGREDSNLLPAGSCFLGSSRRLSVAGGGRLTSGRISEDRRSAASLSTEAASSHTDDVSSGTK